MSPEAIKTLVPVAVYTDRREFIDYFYDYALQAKTRRAMSNVLLGQRRMGKTEIFKRVVNRLFFEQDHTDPDAVVPVYYSFEDVKLDKWDFAKRYVENLLRWHLAFRLHDPTLLSADGLPPEKLIPFIKTKMPLFTEGIKGILRILESIEKKSLTLPQREALQLPRRVSDRDDSTIVMFLDEFQNIRLPHYNFDVVGFMQEAVESPTCPHFVTGSAMTILSKEILGRGALFGRFRSHPISCLTEYWGTQLALRAANHYKTNLPDLMAPIVAERCNHNPFYITAVIQQAAEQNRAITNQPVLDNLLAVDFSSGFIWAELNDQVTNWIRRINDYGITKWVLYLSALEEGDRIEPVHIQQQLLEKDKQDIPLETIRDVLIKLSRGDLLQYMELGGWFRKVDDPILLDFLKVWGRFEVEGHQQTLIITDTIKQYARLKRQINDHKGYLAEVYLSQILWNGQRKTFPGAYFHSPEDVQMPPQFYDIRQRMRLDGSAESEVDVFASTGTETWLCESKWWEKKKVGVDVVKSFLRLADRIKEIDGREDYESGLFTLRLWLFAYSGVTSQAQALLEKHHIYWSTRADLDALIELTGLRKLPDVTG